MISGETTCCRIVRQILRYHVLNKLLSPEKYAHVVMLLFFSIQRRKQLLSGCPSFYQNKLQEQGLQDVVNWNKIKLEPYGDLVDQAFFSITNMYTTKEQKKKNHQVLNVL